ncbi:hypothetical protein, partial [Arcobacter caeni]
TMSYSPDIMKLLEENNIDSSSTGLGTLEYLRLLPLLFEQNKELFQRIKHLEQELIPKLDLTKRAGVKKFLNCSDGKISSMMNDGRLKEGVHFIKELKGRKAKITFIESGIRGYKEENS